MSESVIWKYPLFSSAAKQVDDHIELTLDLPTEAQVLSAQVDNKTDDITLWVVADPTFATTTKRTFAIVPTGAQFPSDWARGFVKGNYYIGTVQQGMFVWHVFEIHS